MSDCSNPQTWIDVLGLPLGVTLLFTGWLPVLAFSLAIEGIGNAKADAIRANSPRNLARSEQPPQISDKAVLVALSTYHGHMTNSLTGMKRMRAAIAAALEVMKGQK